MMKFDLHHFVSRVQICSEVCHALRAFKLYGNMNFVKKNHNYKFWLNDGVY